MQIICATASIANACVVACLSANDGQEAVHTLQQVCKQTDAAQCVHTRYCRPPLLLVRSHTCTQHH
jgi:hypothetical protein